MEKEQFLEFIKTNEDSKSWLKELNYAVFTNDTVEQYLTNSDEGKKILFSKNDKFHNEQLNKWKEKNLIVEVEKLYQQKHPEMTEEQKEINLLKAQLQAKEAMETKYNNIKQLKDVNKDFGLPEEIFELLIDTDLESSKKKITEFGSKYKSNIDNVVKAKVDELLKGSPKPTGGKAGGNEYTMSDLENMSKEELMKLPAEVLRKVMQG